jgi:hypothetical protein
MAPKQKDNTKKAEDEGVWIWASSLSVVYILFLCFLAYESKTISPRDGLGFFGFEGLSLGELGDFFSGAFAPLAFFWLVIAVVIQSKELKEQREELGLTREIMESQLKESKATVKLIKQQTKVTNFEHEQRVNQLNFDTFLSTLEEFKSTVQNHGDDIILYYGRIPIVLVQESVQKKDVLTDLTFVQNRINTLLQEPASSENPSGILGDCTILQSHEIALMEIYRISKSALTGSEVLLGSHKQEAAKYRFSKYVERLELIAEHNLNMEFATEY